MDKINALVLRKSPGAACLESQKQCSQTKCIACGINGGNAELLDPKKEESNLIWPFFRYDPSLVWHHIKGAWGKNEKWCHLNFFQISDVRSLAQPFCTCLFGIAGVGWTPALPSGHRLETCQALPRTSACSEGWSRGLSAVKLYCSPERQFKNFLRNRR